MSRNSDQQIFDAIHNGNEDVLFLLSDKYFQSGRRQLRRDGCRDADTPKVFGDFLVYFYREIQRKKISFTGDLDNYILKALREYFNRNYSSGTFDSNVKEHIEIEKKIMLSCFSIMEESFRKILALRYSENLSFEEIASRLDFSNPFIAEFEFNKAFDQLENIAKARLLMPSEG